MRASAFVLLTIMVVVGVGWLWMGTGLDVELAERVPGATQPPRYEMALPLGYDQPLVVTKDARPLETPEQGSQAAPMSTELVQDKPQALRYLVRVIDEAGRALPDAFMFDSSTRRRGGNAGRPSPTSDAQGLMEWTTQQRANEQGPAGFTVAAPMHRPVNFLVKEMVGSPHVVVLSRVAVLEVRLDVRSQPSPRFLMVTLSSPGNIYEHADFGFDSPAREKLGVDGTTIVGADGSMEVLLPRSSTPAGDWVFVVPGLAPDVEIQVSVQGAGGENVDTALVRMLPGEHRVVSMVVDQPLRSLSGRVTSTAGLPIQGARVFIWPENGQPGRYFWKTTDEDGRYELPEVLASFVTLQVTCEGYAQYEREGVSLEAGGVPDVLLQPETPFTLRIVHAGDGLPAYTAKISTRWKGLTGGRAEWLGEGTWNIPGLPDRPVDIHVYFRGTDYVLTREPGQREAVLEVEDTAQVSVTGLFPTSNQSVGEVVARRLGDSNQLEIEGVGQNEPGSSMELWVITLPEVPAGSWEVLYRSGMDEELVFARAQFITLGSQPQTVTLIREP